MATHKNTRKLRTIMRKHSLTAADVAKITRRAIGTVRIWRCKDDRRVIPVELLTLVELSAAARQADAA